MEVKLANITVELHLYGALACYGNNINAGSASLGVSLPENSKIRDLLTHQGIPTEERGITFINGNLSALPGLQPDLEHILNNNDRVAFFDLKSMWPFQYRHGAKMTDEMSQALYTNEGSALHHTYG